MQYMAGNRRVFAWQVNFETKHWLRVMRLLGRDQVQIHPDSAPLTRWPADTGAAELPSAPSSVAEKRPVSRSGSNPDSAKERGKQAAKEGSPARADGSGAGKQPATTGAAGGPKSPSLDKRAGAGRVPLAAAVRAAEPEPEDAGPTPAEVAAALRRMKASAEAPVAGAKGGERQATPPAAEQTRKAATPASEREAKEAQGAAGRSAPAPAVEVPAAKLRSVVAGKGSGVAPAAPARERVKTTSAAPVAPARATSAARGTAVASTAKPAPAVAAARTGARSPNAVAARAPAAKTGAAGTKVAASPPKAAAGRTPARSTSGTTSRGAP